MDKVKKVPAHSYLRLQRFPMIGSSRTDKADQNNKDLENAVTRLQKELQSIYKM